eukprot:XP_001690919.1 alpha-adaptin [Chlamydomonas reinhardtii]
MSKTAYMRGLQVFISDIRACQNKEQEQRRVEKELAKIRAKFGEDKSLSGYDRRKYIWKLLYIYMLGFDIDFGHKQACDLIPMPKYSDKQVGYMACSLLLQENDEFLRLAINAIHLDLTSRNEAFQALALSFVGNIGGQEMAEALTLDVIKLLTSGASRPLIKKRASLCLLRMLRKTPADAPLVVAADTFSPTMAALLEERDLGLLLCSVTLLHGLVARSGTALTCNVWFLAAGPTIGGYETCQGRVIKILERLVRERERIPPEYLYYGIPSPWLQARCLRALQLFPPPDSATERKALHDVLQNIIATTSAEAAKNANPNKTNALNAILFEALAVALHHASATNNAMAATGPDAANDRATLGSCLSLMGRYLAGKDPNAKYLALDSLARLAGAMPEVLEGVRHHQATVMASLKDPDVSIRRRALDLLFAMCDAASAPEVVGELLKHLVVADFGVREELVLKIAILAEKFAPSMQWYMDVVLQLLERSGDFVSDEIWHRAVQLVTNNPSMQEYAARNSLVCTAAYILGEYGRLIRAEVPPAEQYRLLHGAFPAASQPTKGLLMTALLKIYLLEPTNATLSRDVRELFDRYKRFMDAELQQRATEYLQALAANPQAATTSFILPMPAWQIRESSLIKRLQPEGSEATGEGGLAAAGSLAAADAPSTLAGANTSPLLSVPMPGSGLSPALQPVAATADPFGDSHFGAPPAPAPAPVPPPVPTGDVNAWYSALLLKERGILYEDQYLQIGLQSQYTRGRGNIVLYFGNKHAGAQLTNVSLVQTVQSPGVAMTPGPMPAVLEPKQQLQVSIGLTCLGPFTEAPALALNYGVAGAPALNAMQLRLPVAMHKFMPANKAQEMVDRAAAGPISPETVQGLMRLLHLGVEHGYLDPSPHNEAGAAYWACGPADPQRVVLCCCRVEANPQNRAQFRVTVVADQPELAQGVHALLVAQLKAAPSS